MAKPAKQAKKQTKKAAKQSKAQLVIAVLSRARELLSKGWATEWFAYDLDGKEVGIIDGSACTFCATGAIYRSMHDLTGSTEPADMIFEALDMDSSDLEQFNDNSKTKKPVLKLFSTAIARLEA
jgi:hypothetical protein